MEMIYNNKINIENTAHVNCKIMKEARQDRVEILESMKVSDKTNPESNSTPQANTQIMEETRQEREKIVDISQEDSLTSIALISYRKSN